MTIKKAITRIGLILPAELYLMITDGCNLTCRHCWPRAKHVAEAGFHMPDRLSNRYWRISPAWVFIPLPLPVESR